VTPMTSSEQQSQCPAIIVTNDQGNVIYCNPEGERFLGEMEIPSRNGVSVSLLNRLEGEEATSQGSFRGTVRCSGKVYQVVISRTVSANGTGDGTIISAIPYTQLQIKEIGPEGGTLKGLDSIARIGVGCVDRVTGYRMWSSSLFEIFGVEVPQGEAIEALLLDKLEANDRDIVRSRLSSIREAGGAFQGEVHVAPNEGPRRVLYLQMEVALDAEMRPKMEQYIVQDITEIVQLRKALHASEERFRSFFEQDESIKFLIDPGTGTIRDANHSAEVFYGIPRERLRTMQIREINQISPQEYLQKMAGASRGENNYFQFQHRLGNGELRDVEVFSAPVSLGGELLIHANVHDITDSIKARKALELSQARLQAFYGFTREAILIHHEGTIYDLNEACETLFKVRRDEVTGRSLGALVDPSMAPDWWEKTLCSGRGDPVDVTVTNLEGCAVYLEVATCEMEWMGSRRCVTSIVDVTARKAMEEHLRQSQRLGAIGQLAGGVAHDFNNLLGAIMGFTELALAEAGGNAELAEYLQKIRGASRRARELSRQILAFSRHEAGSRKPVELAGVLIETVSFLKGTVPSSISITQHVVPGACRIVGNATELLQVFMNLSTNAVQAMQDHGTLTLALSRHDVVDPVDGYMGPIAPGKYGLVRVKDTGVGMDRDTLSRIFEPYFTTKPAGSGTGLGLAVVFGIVKSHRGNITVTSMPGKGTTMNLFFPLHEIEEMEAAAPETVTSALRGKGHILLVDDEVVLVELGQKLVSMLGYTVKATTSPLKALELISEAPQKYDLLITDQTMPDMLGTELIREAQLIRPDLPVLLITGYNSKINKNNAGNQGVRHFYMKPLELHEFAKAISAAMGGPTT